MGVRELIIGRDAAERRHGVRLRSGRPDGARRLEPRMERWHERPTRRAWHERGERPRAVRRAPRPPRRGRRGPSGRGDAEAARRECGASRTHHRLSRHRGAGRGMGDGPDRCHEGARRGRPTLTSRDQDPGPALECRSTSTSREGGAEGASCSGLMMPADPGTAWRRFPALSVPDAAEGRHRLAWRMASRRGLKTITTDPRTRSLRVSPRRPALPAPRWFLCLTPRLH